LDFGSGVYKFEPSFTKVLNKHHLFNTSAKFSINSSHLKLHSANHRNSYFNFTALTLFSFWYVSYASSRGANEKVDSFQANFKIYRHVTIFKHLQMGP
jgi:hypothetical protein